MMDHENPICGALGHYVATMTVGYCPHVQGWILTWRAGDDTDDTILEHGRADFGPFDSTDDVAKHVAGLASMLIRVRSRQWAADRSQRRSDSTAGPETY